MHYNGDRCNKLNLDFVAREIAFIGKAPHTVLVNVQKNILALVG
jgi:hypothetical protein